MSESRRLPPVDGGEPCADLLAFAHGELEAEPAEAFRAHLHTCEDCAVGLVEVIQLDARVAGWQPAPAREELPISAPPVSVSPHVQDAPAIIPVAHGARTRRRKRSMMHRAAAVVAALAAAMCLFLIIPRSNPPIGPPDAFAQLTNRPHDIRFAHGEAATYRPRHEMLGAGGASSAPFSREALAALERRDRHALALASVWNGEDLRRATEQLRGLEQTASVVSDRAAIASLFTKDDNLESVLVELEPLRNSSDVMVARAARWNYALLLSRLGLPLSAARAFQAIADEHEPGWSEEARNNAAREARQGQELQTTWSRAVAAGKALVENGSPVPPELIKAVPGVLRSYFYNAVRTAPDASRVLTLAPLAAELDGLGDQQVLQDYVQRIAKVDFGRRAPLARAYAQLLDGKEVSGKLGDQLTTPTASVEVMDIVIGAMVELDLAPSQLDEFRRLVKQVEDPWFEIVLARAEATAEVRRNQWLDAEGRLRRAQARCDPAITYQCLALAHELAALYQDLHRVTDALDVLHRAIRQARSAGEWFKIRQLLADLADAERFHGATAMARAYANEVLLMTGKDDCEYRGVAHRILTGAALLDVDGPAARRHFEAALGCGELPRVSATLATANYLADVGRLDAQPNDVARLQGWLSELRKGGTLTAAELAFADEIEGRLLIEGDRAEGLALLQRAIASTAKLNNDVLAKKVRAGAYSVLIFDAAKHRDHTRAFDLMAQSLGLPPPGGCAVGMNAEDERSVVVVRGADRADRAAPPPAAGRRAALPTVPGALADTLSGCTHVQVLALAGLQGRPRILPATLPWSYATGARDGEAPAVRSPDAAAPPRTLIVTDVIPPSDLRLPTLSASTLASTPTTRTLSGPTATPTRVLAAMHDASEIQFHTHALVDLGVSDASHLVLSQESDGRYALTAESIQRSRLDGRPIVVLAACQSAQGARYQHAPWSLPNAFLSAGARGVLAASTEIPDREAGAFFTRVLQRIRAGVPAAAALRDEKVAALASGGSSWIDDVILFE
jgi:cellulose synthase operon protein C